MNPRIVLIAAIVTGASYYFSDAVAAAGPVHLAWKGAGVGLLAVWAALRARGVDGWLLAVVLGCGAVGDVTIEAAGLAAGAAAFFAGHVVAAALYLRNRRAVGAGGRAVAAAILVAVPLVAWSMPADRVDAGKVAFYAVALGAMAATAASSRFAPARVALGAGLFVLSDWLIFARLGPLAGSIVPDLLTWPLYFAGQLSIATGVVRGLERTA